MTKLFSINEFAKISRTTRDALRHYDRIGLLSPAERGQNENDYRYYSIDQLAAINVIHTLQELGLTLAEIRHIKDRRTPKSMNALFGRQIEKIDGKIEELFRARKLLSTLKKTIRFGLDIDETAVTIQNLPAEAIVLGGINDYSNGKNDYDALIEFYRATSEKYPNLNLNYSVWGIFSKERIKNGDRIWPDRYYFYNPDGHDIKPAATYAVGYKRGGYGESAELYDRLTDYLDRNGFELCGDVYEEYPLNEICVADNKNYLLRVMATVQKTTNPSQTDNAQILDDLREV